MSVDRKAQPTIPYLTIKGAAEALEFYKKAFGAKEVARMPAEDGKRILHAEIAINGGSVMLSDDFAQFGDPPAPSPERPAPVATAIHFEQPSEVDAIFKRAVDAGCTATMEPNDTFWNARFAMLTDTFGHRWMLNAPLPPKT